MKNLTLLTATVAALAILCTGCIKDNDPAYCPIAFTSEIDGHTSSSGTRAYDSTWENDDEIGIYMLPAGGAFSAAHEPNIRYVHTGGGNFEPAPGSRTLFYPTGGTAVDFTAYYPFHDDVHLSAHNHIFPVDVADQSDQAEIDLMIAERVERKTSGGVTLRFSHRLAKIVFNVVDDDTEADLDGLVTAIEGMRVSADCNLETGELTPKEETATITALPSVTTAGDNKASASAIVLPSSPASVSFDVVFSVAGAFETSWTLTGSYERGNIYTYNFRLKGTELIPVQGCVITPWDDNDGENEFPEIELPKGDDGRGKEGGLENALFPGADFEDWDLASEAFGVRHSAITHSPIGGNPGGAIVLNKNWIAVPETALSIKVPDGLSAASSISFDVKGTAEGNGFIVTWGNNGTCFYLGDPTLPTAINPSESFDWGQGSVNTNGEWVKVTLNTRGLPIAGNEYLIAFRCSNANHNLAFDNFTVEK